MLWNANLVFSNPSVEGPVINGDPDRVAPPEMNLVLASTSYLLGYPGQRAGEVGVISAISRM
jgi:hypothetical protein